MSTWFYTLGKSADKTIYLERRLAGDYTTYTAAKNQIIIGDTDYVAGQTDIFLREINSNEAKDRGYADFAQIGDISDAAVSAGASGSVNAKLRTLTSQLNTLITGPLPVSINTGSNLIGKIQLRDPSNSVNMGDATNPVRIDPTGSTPQPIISNQLPSLLTGSGNLKTAILEEIPAGTQLIGSVKQAGSTKTILKEEIDLNTSGDHTLISAPGSGAIKIVNIVLSNNDSSADQVVIFKSGSTSINGAGFTLAPKAFIQFNGSPGEVFWELDATTALHIDISSSTQLSGIVTYYID